MTRNFVFSYIAASLVLTQLIVSSASAQSSDKRRNDHTYSTRNYKHPNKAAAAQQWEPQASITVEGANAQRLGLGDYKRFANRDSSSVTVTVPSSGLQPVRSYKTPYNTVNANGVSLPAEPKPVVPAPSTRPVTESGRPIQQ